MFEGRYLQEELEYIWDYSKKTGFAQYINDDNKEWIRNSIVNYGFTTVQQAIKRALYKRDKSEKKYTNGMVIREFKQQLYLLTVDEAKLEKIKAYIEGKKLNEKQLEEWEQLEKNQLEKYYSFNNFEERDRSKDSDYISYEDIENKLLGWEDDIEAPEAKLTNKIIIYKNGIEIGSNLTE